MNGGHCSNLDWADGSLERALVRRLRLVLSTIVSQLGHDWECWGYKVVM
jgi:hypothetical protein